MKLKLVIFTLVIVVFGLAAEASRENDTTLTIGTDAPKVSALWKDKVRLETEHGILLKQMRISATLQQLVSEGLSLLWIDQQLDIVRDAMLLERDVTNSERNSY